MEIFVSGLQNKQNSETLHKDSLSFKGIKGNGKVTELSDEIFKIASMSIAATGLATLGINANGYLKRKKVEDAETVVKPEKFVTRSELANDYLHVNMHSVDWHIDKGRLFVNEDGLIDVNDERNKQFIESFQKGKRKQENKMLYTKEDYPELQKVLGKYLPVEYCIHHGILVSDEDGNIDMGNEDNKSFIEKIKIKEVSYKDFFMSFDKYADYLSVGQITVQRAIGRGEIVLNEQKRIDINNETNKAFETKVRQAQKRAKEKGLKRVTSFLRVPGDNENLYTLAEFADELGYKSSACLRDHLINGRIVRNQDGFVDISVEPNKSFMEAKRNGTYTSQPRTNKTSNNRKNQKPNEYSQLKLSHDLGISPATLRHHIQEGHVVLNENGKIDIENETNKYFLENYKKGVALYPQKVKEKPAALEEKEIEVINPNLYTVKDFTYITGIAATPILFHISKGRLIRENNKIDITNPVNKRFINNYEEKQLENLDNMNSFQLAVLRSRLENRYKSLLTKSVYVQAKDAKNKSEEEYNAFVKDLVYSLFRVEILSERELKFVENMIKNIIDSRLNDKEKHEDFSDIKEFQLSGVVELEHELNIIDKLIERDNYIKQHEAEMRKIGIKQIPNKESLLKFNNRKIDFSDFLKPQISEESLKKLEEILKRLNKKEETEKIDFDKMTVEELQAKLFEYHQLEALKENTKLLNAIEFLFGTKINTEEEKQILLNFTKALDEFIKNSAEDKEFPSEILAKVHQMEEAVLSEEEQKQAKFEWINNTLTDSVKLLYDRGLSYAADVVFNNLPNDANNEKEIRNAEYIIGLINKLKTEPQLPKEYQNLSDEEKAEQIEKIKKIRDVEIENIMLGFDAVNTNAEHLNDAINYSRTKYGINKYKYIGEYIRHISNLENCDFSSYPKFSEDVLLDLADLDKKDAVGILTKLQEWNTLTEKEQKSFTKMYQMFSKDNTTEQKILTKYLEEYYVNFDTTIMAVGIRDKSLKIPAILTSKAKERMVKEISENNLVDYFEEFERAMTRIGGKDNHMCIKPYESKKNHRTHEVAISYPARLYCHEGSFYIFDEFIYHSHQGANS